VIADENGDGAAEVLPAALDEVVADFAAVNAADRVQLLLDYAHDLPPLPDYYAEHRDELEAVPECQSPLFLAVDVGADAERTVRVHLDAPPEAPTTRGFAGILSAGLDGQPAAVVLAVPDDFYLRLGLAEVVSALRLRGMAAMLARIKRQVREKAPGAAQ